MSVDPLTTAAISTAVRTLINKILQKGYAMVVFLVVFAVTLITGYILFGNVGFTKLAILASVASITASSLELLAVWLKHKEKEEALKSLSEEKDKEISSLKEKLAECKTSLEIERKHKEQLEELFKSSKDEALESCKKDAYFFIKHLLKSFVLTANSKSIGIANNPDLGKVEVYIVERKGEPKLVIVPKEVKTDITVFAQKFWDALDRANVGSPELILQTVERL